MAVQSGPSPAATPSGVPAPPAPTAPAETASGPSPGLASVDTTGARLPAEVRAAARRIDEALRTGEPAAIRDLYEPAENAAAWSTVASRLSDGVHRRLLREALRNPPEPRPEIAYLFSRGEHGLGVTERGRLAFVGVGQRPASGAAGTNRAPAYWVGTFLGHGRSLDVAPSGLGTLRFRTYDECPPDTPGVPCEPRGPEQVARVTLLVEQAGGRVTARVLASNDEPDVPTGRVLPVSSSKPGVLVLGRGDEQMTFCADGVGDPDCGA